ncbi:MAG: FAD-binding oxidoreductase [Deltaproteobacteria bacterium]|mgnify:FL=1|jgi:sarcosine oxidase subunit beta|nr:FAD-binding oxidoreductase [Deltaproteobacteria bacterium]MBT4015320.1 FAD-binding oxidoreductase [Deltaproteobacteria bacterium]MBT5087661.1 FAD-binding oxidoreductase [Deltaproteobacteria bacterium]
MNKKADAIIIGAGVIGSSVAFELAKRGYKTLNIDKLPTSGYGSTSNSCAIVRAHYSTWDGVAMAYEGFFYWDDWANYLGVEDERGMIKYMKTGSIMFKLQGEDHSKKSLKYFEEIGVEHEIWDLDKLKERMPIYSHDQFDGTTRPDEDEHFFDKTGKEIEGAIFTPGSGYVSDPQLSSHNLQVAAEANGGEFLFNNEIKEIRQENGKVLGVILKTGEQIDAPIVVNVAGPHSFVINRMAGVEEEMNIKTKALRHEVHHVPSPEDFDFEKDGFHTSDGDNGIYFRPETGNTILIGSEDPLCDPKEWIEDPDNYNNEVTESQWRAQVYRCARRIPDLKIPSRTSGVVDLYDVSDDWIPIYDKSALGGFYMAIGSSGNQFKNAPVAGHCMAELIDACEKGHDHDANPLKVKTVYTGLELNMGFYSRNREINPNSSFSVNG